MVNDIKDKQVIGPNGEEISQEEAEQLIRSGGGGDNPSDTASLVFDKDSNKVILLFHSDKDIFHYILFDCRLFLHNVAIQVRMVFLYLKFLNI